MEFTILDWIIIAVYFLFTISVGIITTKKAGEGLESYFLAQRSIPWWWLGISILATTFAADTPLAVTGITAKEGIAGNWLWWSWSIGFITVAVFFAARWRESKVLTAVEFIEHRYSGKGASFLRGFKAIYLGLLFNCFILGWVLTAMVKICGPFIHWDQLLNPNLYSGISELYPNILLFKGDLNSSITIIITVVIVAFYSTLGGIRGVILTDLFQFVIAIFTSILFAYYAVEYVGGTDGLLSGLNEEYGAEFTEDLTAFIPGPNVGLLALPIFGVYMIFSWWARYDSDGTGYISQRVNTARSAADAKKGSLLFAFGFIVLRTWPWILVALVTLVVFPMGDPSRISDLGSTLLVNGSEDRESAYPLLMKLILPAGLLGLTFTSLLAAFMSTVDTHLNWGSSYLVNDVYRRFVNPNANQKQLVRVSRTTVVLITIIALVFSSQIESVGDAWIFFINASAGLGAAQLIRWLWWRANAYTEIAGMLAGLIGTILGSILFPDLDSRYQLAIISIFCILLCVIVTLLTKPTEEERLKDFAARFNPFGFWPKELLGSNSQKSFRSDLLVWVLYILSAFLLLFGLGHILLDKMIVGVFELIVGVGILVTAYKKDKMANHS